jgi:hypothetical protein
MVVDRAVTSVSWLRCDWLTEVVHRTIVRVFVLKQPASAFRTLQPA